MFDYVKYAYSRTLDLVLALAFKFWLWLGAKLELTISVPVHDPYYEAIIADYRTEVEALRADLAANLRENEELLAEIQSYVPYVKQGADNRPKLTKREVEEIRKLKRAGHSQSSLAEIYDVNPATISRIVRGQYYKRGA